MATARVDLFWSKRGIVACDTHAPSLDSDEWHLQGWKQVPSHYGTNTAPLQCQFCYGRPYVHQYRERDHSRVREIAAKPEQHEDLGGHEELPVG